MSRPVACCKLGLGGAWKGLEVVCERAAGRVKGNSLRAASPDPRSPIPTTDQTSSGHRVPRACITWSRAAGGMCGMDCSPGVWSHPTPLNNERSHSSFYVRAHKECSSGLDQKQEADAASPSPASPPFSPFPLPPALPLVLKDEKPREEGKARERSVAPGPWENEVAGRRAVH